jgi:hypothetical protein
MRTCEDVMKLVKRNIAYAITDIDVEDFIAWNHSEFVSLDCCLPLNEVMKNELPVFDVDYDGHFGKNLFYTVNVDDDTPELHEKIKAMLVNAIEKAKVDNEKREVKIPDCKCGGAKFYYECCQTYQCCECECDKCECERR